MAKLNRRRALPALAASAVALMLLAGCSELGSAAAQRVQDQLPAMPTLPSVPSITDLRDDAVESALDAARDVRDRLPSDLPQRAVDRVRDELSNRENLPTPEGITEFTITQTTPPAGEVAVLGVQWTDRGEDGGRSLQVRPSQWAREAGFAGWEAVWAEVIAADPSADASNMRDQLICHTIGAGDREVWHLEPWRPDVGLVAVAAARCNP